MLNAVFVVWRECFEAVLVVGILYVYLARRENFAKSKKFLILGVLGGVALSVLIAWGIQHAQSELQGRALEFFEVGILALAAILMTQMCLWMKEHARHIRGNLEAGAALALSTKKLLGVSLLAALAVAREASELVIFFYGMGIEAQESGRLGNLLGSAVLGASLTALTAWAYFKGLKFFKPALFFKVTAVFLFFTASSLLLLAVRKLIQMEVLSPIKDQVWDTAWILDERTQVGQIFSAITGYESAPSLTVLLCAFLYWLIVFALYFNWKEKIFCRISPA